MSCIDSAIIKALVEHIGMNPDDVPTGGGSHTVAGEKLDTPIEVNPVRIKEEDMPVIHTDITMLRLKHQYGYYIDLTCTEQNTTTVSGGGTKTNYVFQAGANKANLTYQDSGDYTGYYVLYAVGDWPAPLVQDMTEASLVEFSNLELPPPIYYVMAQLGLLEQRLKAAE